MCVEYQLKSVSVVIMKAGCSTSCATDSTWMQEAAIEKQWREQKGSDLREIAIRKVTFRAMLTQHHYFCMHVMYYL